VSNARLALNAAKAAMKTAKPERLIFAQQELQRCEDEMSRALQDAIHKMQLVVDSASHPVMLVDDDDRSDHLLSPSPCATCRPWWELS
jgi:hypothetical protein